MPSSRNRALVVMLLVLEAQLPRASAQDSETGPDVGDPPVTALVRTRVPDPQLANFGGAVERVVRARATALGVVQMSGTPALGLEDIQLMVGCLNDSPDCYDAFAEQLDVEALLLPTLERAGEEYLVTVTFYDRRTRELKSEARRGADRDVEASLIAAIDTLLRVLFDLPPAPEDSFRIPDRDPAESGMGVVPGIAIGLVGVAALGAALGVGVAARNANDDFISRPNPSTPAEVDALLELRDGAQRKSTTATALSIAGGVVLGAGAILLVLALTGDDADDDEDAPAEPDNEVALAPMLGRGLAGLSIGGTL